MLLERFDFMKKFILILVILVSFIISGCFQENKYSIDEYDSLYTGMTYQECEILLDSPGFLMSETKIPGINTYQQIYSWKNDDGSNMVLLFDNNILVSKSQIGLQKQGHYSSITFLPFVTSLFSALVLAFIPAYIAKRKGRNFKRWYIYGLFIWIVAFIHSLLLSDHSGLQCPSCKNWIKENSSVCKYCHIVLADYYRDHPELPADKYDKEDTLL